MDNFLNNGGPQYGKLWSDADTAVSASLSTDSNPLSLPLSQIKDMGKVMGSLKKEYSDEIDFTKAGSLIKELLNK